MNILEKIFPRIKVSDLKIQDASTLHHIRQIQRRREPPPTLGACGPATFMTLVAQEGKFISDGETIRRVE